MEMFLNRHQFEIGEWYHVRFLADCSASANSLGEDNDEGSSGRIQVTLEVFEAKEAEMGSAKKKKKSKQSSEEQKKRQTQLDSFFQRIN